MAQKWISVSSSPGSAWVSEAEPFPVAAGVASCLAGSQGRFRQMCELWAGEGTAAALIPTLGWESLAEPAGSALSATWHTPGEGTSAGLRGAAALPSLFQHCSCQDGGGVSAQQWTRGGSLSFCCLQLKLGHDCLRQSLAIEFIWNKQWPCAGAFPLWSLHGSQFPMLAVAVG